MKKALKINLSGQIFHIDEDAYEKLKNYLDTLSSHFSNTQERNEIISDIESRIAELFRERLRYDNQVISIKDIDEIIGIMGKPEEIADEGNEENSGRSERRSSRRLFRDPDNNIFGGVCSGLGFYFNIESIIIRILFIILILVGWGFPVLIYLILWIAVPKAKTAAEKLEMKGEKVNISNIEKAIREEYESLKENLKKVNKSEIMQKTESFFTKLLKVIGIIFIALAKIILAIIAFSFILIGITFIIWLFIALFFGKIGTGFYLNDNGIFDSLFSFITTSNVNMIVICFLILLFIPLLAIIYGLLRMIFKFRAKNKILGWSAIILWFLTLIILISAIAIEFTRRDTGRSISQLPNINSLQAHSQNIKIDKRQEHTNNQAGILYLFNAHFL